MSSPRTYGRYELLERVAVGGMGEIWRAKLTGLEGFEKTVAIKKILPHLSDDPQFVERLVVEAKIAVALSHAHVVEVYELGTVEGEYYIAMEYVDGPDLATLLYRADRADLVIPLPLALYIGSGMCKALEYAHRKEDESGKPMNIVHRDVSPQNILLSTDGAVKLSDFGIARAAGVARAYHTEVGVVLGKRRYMAPEQRKGETVDSRADVFSCAAVIYEMITGTPPEEDDPVKPSELVPHVPEEVDRAVMDALTQRPGPRPRAGRLATQLDRLYPKIRIDGETPPPDPASALGALIRDLFPPEEKKGQGERRSLTDFVNAAMGRQHSDIGPDLQATGTVHPPSANPTASSAIELSEPSDGIDERPSEERTAPSAVAAPVDVAPARRPPGDPTIPPETAVIVATARKAFEHDKDEAEAPTPLRDGEGSGDVPSKPTQPTSAAAAAAVNATGTEASEDEGDPDPFAPPDFDPPTQPSRFAPSGRAIPQQDGGAFVPDTSRAPEPGSRVDIFPQNARRPKASRAARRIPGESGSGLHPAVAGGLSGRVTAVFRYLLDSPDARWLRIIFLVLAAVLAIGIGVGLGALISGS